MDRLTFLRRSSIALAGGLILGPAALEEFERLTHVRKSFPSAAINTALLDQHARTSHIMELLMVTNAVLLDMPWVDRGAVVSPWSFLDAPKRLLA